MIKLLITIATVITILVLSTLLVITHRKYIVSYTKAINCLKSNNCPEQNCPVCPVKTDWVFNNCADDQDASIKRTSNGDEYGCKVNSSWDDVAQSVLPNNTSLHEAIILCDKDADCKGLAQSLDGTIWKLKKTGSDAFSTCTGVCNPWVRYWTKTLSV